MPCGCKAGKCASCACAKAGAPCGHACHGGAGLAGNCGCLNFPEAQQAKALGVAKVRRTLAQHGLDCMGNKDELVRRLADHLRSLKASSAPEASSGGGGGGDGGGSGGGGGGGSRLIQSIIAKADAGEDDAAILSLSGISISSSSSTADMRKAYLKLSLKIHPDKNGNSPDSKSAFQTLVTAYEALSNPEAQSDGSTKKPRQKAKQVVRSNAGCHNTKVHCPRCHMEWGRAELGLETAAYNLLMMGLKEYVCGRCACSFGCMTAAHKCPHCRKPFDYSPQDYHRKIVCGNAGCTREFGFMQYKLSDRREEEVRKEVKTEQEARLKKREGQARRAARSAARSGTSAAGSKESQTKEEQLFVLGLLDDCPRCGRRPETETAEGAMAHLAHCNDAKAIAAHTAARQAAEQRRTAASRGQIAQEEAMAVAQWEFGGRQVGQLWMLSESAIRQQCEVYNVQLTSDGVLGKPKLIALLAKALRTADKGRLLTDGSEAMAADAAPADTAGIEDVEHHELPTNLNTMEAEQLKAVCASYGINFKDGDLKATLIRRIEAARYKHEPQMLLEGSGAATLALTNGGKRRGAKRRRKESDSDDDDDDGEEEYRPDSESASAVGDLSKAAKRTKNAPTSTGVVHAAKLSGCIQRKGTLELPTGPQGQQARGLVKARQRADGVMEYKVRWHGCDKASDTWVSGATLPEQMISRYNKKMAEKKRAMGMAASAVDAS